MNLKSCSRRLLQKKLYFFLAFFLSFSMIGCGGCGKSAPKSKKATDNPDARKSASFKKVVVLLHGLGCPGDLNGFAEILKKDLPDYEIITLDRDNSTQAPTTQQADEMYNLLKTKIQEKGLNKPSICLLGDSHGGLVALEIYRKYKNELNIRGIITNHSPLEGAPGLTASPDSIDKFKAALKDIMLNSKDAFLVSGANMLGQFDIKALLVDKINQVVINDLTANSPLLKNINSTLSTIQIPVMPLAGKVDVKMGIVALLGFVFTNNQDNLIRPILPQIKKALDNASLNSIQNLEMTFGEVIAGKGNDKANDCFIPYYSQVGEHIKASPTVSGFRSSRYHHFYGMSNHKIMYDKIIQFIKTTLADKK